MENQLGVCPRTLQNFFFKYRYLKGADGKIHKQLWIYVSLDEGLTFTPALGTVESDEKIATDYLKQNPHLWAL